VSGERLRYVLPGRSFSLPLGSPRVRLGRCFLPTSATDYHDEHPRTVRVPSARREPCRPRDLPTEIRRLPRRRAISSRSSTVAQPQVDARLTTRLQLRSCRPPPVSKETSRAPRERGCLATALSTACQAGDRPLTLSVAPRFWISTNGYPDAGDQLEEPAPVPPHPRQKERHPRRRASSIDKCSQDRLSPIGSVPLGTGRNPPPNSRLCHHDSGFRHLFAPCRSRVGGLDPRQHQGLFTHGRRGPRAACRFLQP
jgi:hypothetical protein